MRLQLTLPLEGAGLPSPCSREAAESGAEAMVATLEQHGIAATIGQDEAYVAEDSPDWSLLTPSEREEGVYDYAEVIVAGVCHVAIAIFRTEIFFSSDSSFTDDQADAAHVISVLRALDSTLQVDQRDWELIIARAADHAVNADGTIGRPLLGFAELSGQAAALFDQVYSAELVRPWAEDFVRDHGGQIRELAAAQPEAFAAYIATTPDGGASLIEMPRGPDGREFRPGFERLREAMTALLKEAGRQPWAATGLPIGLRVTGSAAGETDVYLVFDNLLDAGAVDPSQRERGYRAAPHGWDSATIAAAARDPRFQPSWLPAAVALAFQGGMTVEVNTRQSPVAIPDRIRDLQAEGAPVTRRPMPTPGTDAGADPSAGATDPA